MNGGRVTPSEDFAAKVIAWQRMHGRQNLPWQNTRNPYRIWLSEIMLQQTQVGAVIPYYERFLARFPDLVTLAHAAEDDVLRLWAGLGYYARARNLHRAARAIVQAGGAFPQCYDAVADLPGVGCSTAAAICAFAFGARRAILDGNVKRVLARSFGVEGYPGERRVEQMLWALAESLLPGADIEAYTQGLMDLGASICVRRAPRCGICPLRGACVAYRDQRTDALPTPRPSKLLPQRETTLVALCKDGAVLLEKRPAPGIWGGLWCLPEIDASRLRETCLARFGAQVAQAQPLATIEHGFTHFRLRIHPLLVFVSIPASVDEPGRLWLRPEDAVTAAVPVPVRKILAGLARDLTT